MPKRSAGQLQQLAKARASANEQEAQATIQAELDDCKIEVQSLKSALALVENSNIALLKDLEDEKQASAALLTDLDKAEKKSIVLSQTLQATREHAGDLYQKLRVAHRARQRAEAKNQELAKQIGLLKSADLKKSDELKFIKKNVSTTVETLIKVEKHNTTLQKELSNSLDRCAAEVKKSCQAAKIMAKKVKKYHMLVSKFQKQCY